MSIYTQIRNLTPHTVALYAGSGELIDSWASEGQARCVEHVTRIDPGTDDDVEFQAPGGLVCFDIPVVRRDFGCVTGLPEPQHDTLLIVSQLVFDAQSGRTDLLVPHDMVRDSEGRIIGCRAFARR